MSAVAVFSTYALAEQILLLLPPTALFSLQGVSHAFHAVIARSISLQKRMWLLPSGGPRHKNNRGVALSPLLHHNTTSFPLISTITTSPNRKRRSVTIRISPPSSACFEGSWRDVYITSPPITRLWLVVRNSNWGGRLPERVVLGKEGLRFADVWDEYQAFVDEIMEGYLEKGMDAGAIVAGVVVRKHKGVWG